MREIAAWDVRRPDRELLLRQPVPAAHLPQELTGRHGLTMSLLTYD